MLKSFYQLLGFSTDSEGIQATQDEIKKRYQQLALQLHPDKQPQAHQEFTCITQAYNTLKDPISRQEYNASLQLQQVHQSKPGPIHCEIDLDEMEYNQEESLYYLDCERCGNGRFEITYDELAEGISEAACSMCSLRIIIHYQLE